MPAAAIIQRLFNAEQIEALNATGSNSTWGKFITTRRFLANGVE
jgi:hypothetical protein